MMKILVEMYIKVKTSKFHTTYSTKFTNFAIWESTKHPKINWSNGSSSRWRDKTNCPPEIIKKAENGSVTW